MPALKILELSFQLDKVSSISAWKTLAEAPRFRNLEELVIRGCDMRVHDMIRFVLKQTETLTLLDISSLGLHEGTMSDIRTFYAMLSKACKLEDFHQHDLALVSHHQTETIVPPSRLRLPGCHDGEVEDDYVVVGVWSNLLHWKGLQEVQEVLADLAVCLF